MTVENIVSDSANVGIAGAALAAFYKANEAYGLGAGVAAAAATAIGLSIAKAAAAAGGRWASEKLEERGEKTEDKAAA